MPESEKEWAAQDGKTDPAQFKAALTLTLRCVLLRAWVMRELLTGQVFTSRLLSSEESGALGCREFYRMSTGLALELKIRVLPAFKTWSASVSRRGEP